MSHLDHFCVKQGLTFLLGLMQDELGEMGQHLSRKLGQVTQCFPLVLYSKEVGMQMREAPPNAFLGISPF